MSLPLPNPSQPRRSKTILSPEGTTAKFLYTIIKQLDLKSIDWNEIASQLEITNGHAARMRYSRFKTQIEALSKEPTSKAKMSGKDHKSKQKSKGKRGYEDMQMENSYAGSLFAEDDGEIKRVKHEIVTSTESQMWSGKVKTEAGPHLSADSIPNIKTEQDVHQARIRPPQIAIASLSDPKEDDTQVGHESADSSRSSNTVTHQARSVNVPAMTDTIQDPPNVLGPAGSTWPRPQYRRYYPQYNYQYGSQPRHHPFPYQNMMPQYGRFPRTQYQQIIPQSMYAPSAYELAAQASYPWPYSEADLAQSSLPGQKITAGTHVNHGTTNLHEFDFSEFSNGLTDWHVDANKTSDPGSDQASEATASGDIVITAEESSKDEQIQKADGNTSQEAAKCKPFSSPAQCQAEPTASTEVSKETTPKEPASKPDKAETKEPVPEKDQVVVKIEPEIVVV